tara:strand:+ start:1738 stop:2238 length:501 start_codon:yes stop_codon:yes gene_type:complete
MNEFDLRKFLYSKSLLKEEITKEEPKAEITEETKVTTEEEVTEEVVEETEVTTEEEVTESPKLTKESLKSLIREKITSILNEAEEDEAEEEEMETEEAPEEDLDTTEPISFEMGDGEENEVIKLFSTAKKEISELGADEETKQKMMRQINNTITMFAREYLAKEDK